MAAQTLLVANRGEIAIRVIRAARDLGLRTVAVYAEDDARCLHVRRADVAVALQGRGAAAYLDIPEVLAVAQRSGAELIHPGYGFLSERAEFAGACEQVGLTFVGPTSQTLSLLGDKTRARQLAARCEVPVLPGSAGATTLEEMQAFARDQGPHAAIVVKAIAGGGGRGMRVVRDIGGLEAAHDRCRSEAASAFGDGSLYVERLAEDARHVEVQVIGDGSGEVSHLWERDCSVQRRHQKLVEIAPAVGLSSDMRERMVVSALRMAREVAYRGLGTIEFLVYPDGDAEAYAFIEANPRLQVEHTVTEQVTGVDLVRAQLRIAQGASLADLELTTAEVPEPRGVAVQVRVNMETMEADSSARPGGGTLSVFEPPGGPGLRVDTFGYAGYTTTPSFDSLLAKVVAHTPEGGLPDALALAYRGLCEFRIEGVPTNLAFLQNLLRHPTLVAGAATTDLVDHAIAGLISGEGASHPRLYFDDGAPPSAPAPAATQVVPEGLVGVLAQMQGSVVTLDVEQGAQVLAGQPLLVMEAMKMEHVIEAPTAGRVVQVLVLPGDIVMEGQGLVFIEPGTAAGATDTSEAVIDLEHIRPDLQEVIERHAYGLDENRPAAVDKRHARGHRMARENLADLIDEGSFIEYGALAIAAQRRRRDLQELIERTPADGMIAGVGSINGALFEDKAAQCMVIAYDFTVLAGTQGTHNHRKNDRVFDIADKSKLPIVFFTEGGGGRPGDVDKNGVSGLDTTSFGAFARLSGHVPLVGVTTGRCFAGNASFLGCCDVIIATKDSNIGMGGPAMIEGGGLGVYTPEQVGPMAVQVPNGVVDIAVEDELQAVAAIKKYLSYFQGAVKDFDVADQRLLRHLIPENRMRIYEVREVLETLADTGSVLELRRGYAAGMVTAFVRVEGRPLGVIANNPRHNAGAIDSDGADKASRFMQLCDAFDIPILFLCDCPGFMVGPESEKTATVRHTSRMYVTAASLTVPFFSIVLRKAYGLGAMAMFGGSVKEPFFVIGWPTAEFGPMGLEGAVKLGFKRELEAIEDPAERKKAYDAMVAAAYQIGKGVNVASHFEVDDIIDPVDSRHWIVSALRSAPTAAPRRGKKRFVDPW